MDRVIQKLKEYNLIDVLSEAIECKKQLEYYKNKIDEIYHFA